MMQILPRHRNAEVEETYALSVADGVRDAYAADPSLALADIAAAQAAVDAAQPIFDAVADTGPVSTTDFNSLVASSPWLAQSADLMGAQTSGPTGGGAVNEDFQLVDGKAYYLFDGTLVVYHAADAGLDGDQGTLEFIDAHDGFQLGGVAAGESVTFADIPSNELGYFLQVLQVVQVLVIHYMMQILSLLVLSIALSFVLLLIMAFKKLGLLVILVLEFLFLTL